MEQLEVFVATKCMQNYDYSIWSKILVLSSYLPYAIYIGMYAIGIFLRRYQLYYMLLSIGMTIEWCICLAIQRIIKIEPHIKNCGGKYSMPSSPCQDVFFFYTMVMTYFILQRKRLGLYDGILLNLLPIMVCISRYLLGFDTIPEIFAGSLAGIFIACTWQYMIFVHIRHKTNYILSWRISRLFRLQDDYLFIRRDIDNEEYESPNDMLISDEANEFLVKENCAFCNMNIEHDMHIS